MSPHGVHSPLKSILDAILVKTNRIQVIYVEKNMIMWQFVIKYAN